MVHHEGSGAFFRRRRRRWRFGTGTFAGMHSRVLSGTFRFVVGTHRAGIQIRLSLVAKQQLVMESKET